jgi:hypothetical protein
MLILRVTSEGAADFALIFELQSWHGGVWRSLVAHLVWDQGVQGSNPCTPTKKHQGTAAFICRFSLLIFFVDFWPMSDMNRIWCARLGSNQWPPP